MSGNPKSHGRKKRHPYPDKKSNTSTLPTTVPALRGLLKVLQERISAVDAREHDLDRANIPRSALEHTKLCNDRAYLEGKISDALARIEDLERRERKGRGKSTAQ